MVLLLACSAIGLKSAANSPVDVHAAPTLSKPSHRGPEIPLLVISKGRFSAYLLPESHIGFPAEFSPYFHSTVLRAARRSTTLIHEGADLDTWPESRHWGGSCIGGRPELSDLATKLVDRITVNHEHSQWADLHRSFRIADQSTAEMYFSVFIAARGGLINLIELEWLIQPGLERKLAMSPSTASKSIEQEYLGNFGVRERIKKHVPQLKSESIEAFEDLATSVCSLDTPTMSKILSDAIHYLDGTEERVRQRKPGAMFSYAASAFDLLRSQLMPAESSLQQSQRAVLDSDGRVDSAALAAAMPGLGRGPEVDRLWLGLRTERWASRIEEHARSERTGLFYSLGALHLIDYGHFDGLLTLLEGRGFRVGVMHSDGHVVLLRRRSLAHDRSQAPLRSR